MKFTDTLGNQRFLFVKTCKIAVNKRIKPNDGAASNVVEPHVQFF